MCTLGVVGVLGGNAITGPLPPACPLMLGCAEVFKLRSATFRSTSAIGLGASTPATVAEGGDLGGDQVFSMGDLGADTASGVPIGDLEPCTAIPTGVLGDPKTALATDSGVAV
jgi:hypothetical protein